MPTYLVLSKGLAGTEAVTDEEASGGASPVELNQARVEELGGELLDLYYTSDEYDAAMIIEFPDQETMLRARHAGLELVDDLKILDAVHYEDVDNLIKE